MKDVRNILRLEKLKKKITDVTIKGIRNFFRLEKEKYLEILEIILRMKKKKFTMDPVIVSNFWSNDLIECESNSIRNIKISVEECLNEIIVYLKDTINNLRNEQLN